MARRLLFLNGLAIISVVLFHAGGMGFVAMFSWGERYLSAGVVTGDQIGSISYYVLRIVEQITVFAIPAFLFISGYSTAISTGRNKKGLSWNLISNRIKSLLIPYLVWSFVVILLRLLEERQFTPASLITTLLTGNANETLYYIPLLIQFYLLSPLIVTIARWNWKVLLIIVGILQIIVILLSYLPLLGPLDSESLALLYSIPKWFFLSRIFWFPFGIVAGFNASSFKAFLEKYWRVSLILSPLLFLLGILEWEILFRLSGLEWLPQRDTMIDFLFHLTTVGLILGLQSPLTKWYDNISRIGVKSYGIYLTHAIFIVYTARFIYHVAPNLLAYQIILQPTLISVGIGLPLLMMYLVDKSQFRKVYPYVFG